MKSYTQLKSELDKKKPQELPSLETTFGQKDQDYPTLETTFGQKDQENKKSNIEEAKTPSLKDQIGRYTNQEQTKIHNSNKTKDLTPHEVSAIRNYTGQGYSSHNQKLYKTKGKSGANTHLDSALNKSNFSHQTHVYTGLKVSPSTGFKDTDKSNSTVFHHPAYISTSTNFDTAKKFARDVYENKKPTRHILKIQVPKDANAMSVKHHSLYDNENEILLHRGHHIEIHHKPTITKDSYGNNIHVWHGRLVGKS